ncbi:hypothetical protein GG851_00075 [Bordetella petrii]|nr:hypothetical protein [Bordetella petrii]
MKIRKTLKLMCAGAVLSAVSAFAAQAETNYPAKAVRIVIPYSPGGITDLVARALSESLTKKWGQPVIVENKPGGSESIAAAAVAASHPDGSTILLASDAAYVINALTMKNLPYKPADLSPVVQLAEGFGVLVVNTQTGVDSIGELLALANRKPGEVTYGSEAIGSPSEFRMRILGEAAGGYKFNHIPYKGSGAVTVDLLGGRLDSAWLPPHLAKTSLESKAIKAISITGPAESPMFPGVKTAKEQGYGAVDVVSFKMMLAVPKGTPQPIIDKIATDVAAIIKDPAFDERYIKANGYTVIGGTPADFQAYLESAQGIFSKLVKDSGLAAK